jgi:hypothetical protein
MQFVVYVHVEWDWGGGGRKRKKNRKETKPVNYVKNNFL